MGDKALYLLISLHTQEYLGCCILVHIGFITGRECRNQIGHLQIWIDIIHDLATPLEVVG